MDGSARYGGRTHASPFGTPRRAGRRGRVDHARWLRAGHRRADADQADGDVCDNCPEEANADQADADSDGIGDVCRDRDGDGLVDALDRCPDTADDGADTDGDGVIDPLDRCPTVADPAQAGDDDDCDGIVDELCDCIALAEDCDGGDEDCDGLTDEGCPGVVVSVEIDNDGDGRVDEGYDRDMDGYAACAGDCDDREPLVNPEGYDNCNRRDDDCDGRIDEECL